MESTSKYSVKFLKFLLHWYFIRWVDNWKQYLVVFVDCWCCFSKQLWTCSLRMTPNQNFGKSHGPRFTFFSLWGSFCNDCFFSLKNCCYFIIGCHQDSFSTKKRILSKRYATKVTFWVLMSIKNEKQKRRLFLI